MSNSVVFLNQTYLQTQALLRVSRDYIKWQAPLDIRGMKPQMKYKVTNEAMRISVRLNQITVWLLIQREINKKGSSLITRNSDDYKVLQGKAYLDQKSETDPKLPLQLREILQMSRVLYCRVLRLHEASCRRPYSPNEIKKAKRISIV